MRCLRTEKLRLFHLRPFIVLTIAKRAHYKAEKETTCSVNVLKLGLGLGLIEKMIHSSKPIRLQLK